MASVAYFIQRTFQRQSNLSCYLDDFELFQ